MKLCDIGADRYNEVMGAAPALIEKLAVNEEFKAMMFKGDIDPESSKKKAVEVMNARVLEHLPKLMVNAKSELIDYFSLLNGVSPEEYEKNMTIGTIFGDILETLGDKVFLNFFYSYQIRSSE